MKQSRLPPRKDSGLLRCARNDGVCCQTLILRSAERASRRMKVPPVASPFETPLRGSSG
jgi:hypothetical protein